MTAEAHSTFSWLAHSNREYRQAQDLASALGEQDTRDELGIAGIRDTLSDLLFPGTSTIQTRARYFLFVPWLYRRLERSRPGGLATEAAKAERRLMRALIDAGDFHGLIGSQKPNVERLPSSIYWQGLHVLRIRRRVGSQTQYHRWLDDPRRVTRGAAEEEDVPSVDGDDSWWHQLPSAPDSFPNEATFALTRDEALYLRDHAQAHPAPTMLAFLFRQGRSEDEAGYPWRHPQLAALEPAVREIVDVAELFSLGHHGAALLYNLLIAEARDDDARTEGYTDALARWAAEAEADHRLATFELGRLWALMPAGRFRRTTEDFVTAWFGLVRQGGLGRLARLRDARELIRAREVAVKTRVRSRIENPDRVAWNGSSGASRLDYRWRSSVQRIVLDVAKGRESAVA